MSWKSLFQNHILERGLNYYLEDRVTLVDKQQDSVTATVDGTELYVVEADFEKEQVVSLVCTCPYAAADNFCKHMAAVLYAYETDDAGTPKRQKNKSAKEYVNEADERFVRDFLADILSNESRLLNQFIVAQGHPITEVDMDLNRIELRHIFSDHLYPNNFIDYNSAWDFHSDISQYMTQTIKNTLIVNGHYKEAFELINEIFLELIDLSIDDSAGTLTDIASECMALWEMILERCPYDFKNEMFTWFTYTSETTSLDFLDDYIEAIIFSHFHEEEFMEKKMALAKRRVEQFKMGDSDYLSRYSFEKWAIYYLQSLDAFESLKEEQEKFCEDHLEYTTVREFFADKLIASADYEKAIRLLEEGKKEGTKGGLSEEYHVKLKELYKNIGEEKEYRKTLFDVVTEYGSRRMDLYEEYKAQFNKEEWLDERESLIEAISLRKGKDVFLDKEEMYAELLQLAIDTPGLSVLQKYEPVLYEINSEKVLDKYEKEILEQSKLTSNRKAYRGIAAMIRQMRQISSNHDRVEELISYLIKTYKNRPAMMDELSHL